jgi:hypothetical protein
MGKISIKVNLDTQNGLIDKEFVLNIDDSVEEHLKARISKSINLNRTNSLKTFLNAYINECFENVVKDKVIDNLLDKLEDIEEK